MGRLTACFNTLKKTGKKGLVPFITAGDPEPWVTVPLMHALVEGGADVVELGVPFSDPMADGPVIQRSSERALAHHVSLRNVLGMVAEFRKNDQRTPVVLMGYLNPIEAMGYRTFATEAGAAGVDGVLTVDLPPEEAAGLCAALAEVDVDPVFLLAPTTTEARMERIGASAKGFVYYVSLKGVTGSDKLDIKAVETRLNQIRKHTDLPVGVGFGIKDSQTAAKVSAVCDAVVIGSAIVDRMAALAVTPEKISPEIKGFIEEVRQGMDAAE